MKVNRYWKQLIGAFLVPVFLLLIIYWKVGIYPFGDHSVGYGDLANQYVALMSYFKNNFFHPANFLYSTNFALGGNFFPVYAYYLTSPINLLSLVFPVKDMLLFFEFNILFNAGLTGLTTYLYLTHSYWLKLGLGNNPKMNPALTIAFSTSFSLSSFFFDYSRCAMWFNAIAIMPLVFWGLERLIRNKSPWLYFMAFSFLLLSNYYIGYIVTLFLIFTIVFLVIYALWVKKKAFSSVIYLSTKIFIYSLASLMVSAIFVLPSIIAQKNVQQEVFKYSFDGLYKLSDLFPAMLPNIQPAEVPVLFTSLFCLLFLIIYFAVHSSAVGIKEKILVGVFLILLILSTWFTNTYMVWHAFTMPNGYHNRESFVLGFVIVLLAYRGLESYLNTSKKKLGIGIEVSLTLLVLCLVLRHYLALKGSIEAILLLICYVSVLFVIRKTKYNQQIFPSTVILLLVCIDIGLGNYKQVEYLAQNSTSLNAHKTVLDQGRKVITKIKGKDHGLYRIGTTYQVNPNDPLQFNYNGVQSYLSQQPTKLTDFLSMGGYFQKHSWLRWSTYNNGSTKAMDDLLGIKYLVSNNNSHFIGNILKIRSLPANNWVKPRTYNKEVMQTGNFKVYQNNSLPLAFLSNRDVSHLILKYDPEDDPFDNQNKIFDKILNTRQQMYTKVNKMYVKRASNQIVISYTPRITGQNYLYIPFNINRLNSSLIRVLVNGKVITTAFGNDLYGENGIIALGKLKKGAPVQVKVTGANASQIYTGLPYLSVENPSTFTQIRKQAYSKKIHNTMKIAGTRINLKLDQNSHNKFLVFSLPYDKGWSASVDGKQVPIKQSLGNLMSVKLRATNRQISLKYSVPGLQLGIVIALLGIVLCFLAFCLEKFFNKPE